MVQSRNLHNQWKKKNQLPKKGIILKVPATAGSWRPATHYVLKGPEGNHHKLCKQSCRGNVRFFNVKYEDNLSEMTPSSFPIAIVKYFKAMTIMD